MKLLLSAWILSVITFTSLSALAHTQADFYPEFLTEKIKVTIKSSPTAYRSQMALLKRMDIDIAGIDFKRKLIDVYVNSEEYEKLQERRFVMFGQVQTLSTPKSPNDPRRSGVDPLYKNPEQIEQILKRVNRAFPNITKLIKAGDSFEGKPIWVLKISDNPERNEADEPAILFNSMHHAREVMTPEVALDIIEQLTSGYGKNEKITSWVNDNQIWVMPMLNVDGNNKVWTENPMWRKNTRDGHGVDINRNYPHMWGSCNGSSGSKFSDVYRGPKAASEPETQTIMKLVSNIRPVFDISFHSYSELVIYPMGCDGERAVNAEIVEPIGKKLGELLGYTPGTSWEILYSVDGGDIDWMNNEYQVIPYVLEVNSRSEGFQPPYATTRERTVKKVRPAWQYLLEQLQTRVIVGQVRNSVGVFSGKGFIQVLKKVNGQFRYYTHYKLSANGRFNLVLPDGEYLLRNGFHSEGVTSFGHLRKTITVSGSQRMHVALE